jgi:hypothetical protein
VFINFSKKAKERIEKLKAGKKPIDDEYESDEENGIIGSLKKETDEFTERMSRVIQLKMNKINEGMLLILLRYLGLLEG